VLAGYFDESGLDEKSQTFCVGGYVADSKDWFELTRAWEQLLPFAPSSGSSTKSRLPRQGRLQWLRREHVGREKRLDRLAGSRGSRPQWEAGRA
jgi:hypothetical protein